MLNVTNIKIKHNFDDLFKPKVMRVGQQQRSCS